MTGGTNAHSAIQGNLIAALNNRLRGKPCRPHGFDFKVQAERSYRYPDATVATEPVVVFEVLSRGKQRVDRTIKLAEYQRADALLALPETASRCRSWNSTPT